MDTIYVDGGCNKTTGDSAWGSVVDQNGVDLIKAESHPDLTIEAKSLPGGKKRNVIIAKATDVKSQQNNFAELLAMVVGLRFCLESNKYKIICSDSQLIIQYWSTGHVNSKTWNKMDPVKQKYITECSKLRESFEKKGGKIIKISGDVNKADLGYHK